MTAPAAEKKEKKILGVTPNVFFMGLTSLLTDISSELIFTLVPLFLSDVLGVSSTIIGLVGGLSDSMDSLFRIFSGWLSDKIGKRKLLATLGYSISTIAKPFMLLANSWGAVLGVRLGGRGSVSSCRGVPLCEVLPERAESGRHYPGGAGGGVGRELCDAVHRAAGVRVRLFRRRYCEVRIRTGMVGRQDLLAEAHVLPSLPDQDSSLRAGGFAVRRNAGM